MGLEAYKDETNIVINRQNSPTTLLSADLELLGRLYIFRTLSKPVLKVKDGPKPCRTKSKPNLQET